jgi:haloacetate dehalogenase
MPQVGGCLRYTGREGNAITTAVRRDPDGQHSVMESLRREVVTVGLLRAYCCCSRISAGGYVVTGPTTPFERFRALEIQGEGAGIFLRLSGSGPPILLLHGFPQTHLMWRLVAPLLARHFTVVCADLRGYGRSGCPSSCSDPAPYTKRAMANDMVSVMGKLGFSRFSIAGHDRGGRVAYRLALDHRQSVDHLAVLDILTVADAWERADKKLAVGYWPWSLLAQPEPLPERLILAAPDVVVDDALSGWGSPKDAFSPEVRMHYIDALRDPTHVHAICEEYRAAATLDHNHDRADQQAGRRIACPVLVLWSGLGPLNSWYTKEGGPLALWRKWANDVRGKALDAGHFFPEEIPQRTADELNAFFAPVPERCPTQS